MPRYRIYYDDGRTITDGEPFDVAQDSYGVICILIKKKCDGRYYMASNAPYYLMIDDEWMGAWHNDLEDYMIHARDKVQQCLKGRLVGKSQFISVFEQAQKDKNAEVLS